MSPEASRIESIVEQIRKKIRSRVADSERPVAESGTGQVSALRERARGSRQLLTSLDNDIAAIGHRIGSCPPSPYTFRARLGAFAIRVLSGVLWWQHVFVKDCIRVIVRRNREQAEAIDQMVQIVAGALEEGLRTAARFEESQRVLAEREEDERRQVRQEVARLSSQGVLLLEEMAALRSAVGSLELRISAAEIPNAAQRLAASEAEVKRLSLAMDRTDGLIAGIQGDLQEQCSSIGGRIREQADAVVEIQKAVLELEAAARQSAMASAAPPSHFDEVYVSFEDCFRGSRSEIKERQRIYLPLLRGAGAGTPERPIVDLGCGRGEWLELLREEALVSCGVDRNPGMLEECRTLGLDAIAGDALSYLRGCPELGLGAITSFHMIEHLPVEEVIALLAEAFRVLEPNGLLILETPNPGNIAVGASTFYIDPSHVRPIPMATLRFLVETRGFRETEIRELHPYPAEVALAVVDSDVARRFNELFYGPQDYALICRKPGSKPS